MRLIDQLEGLSGENLASSLLTYILQRSPETRAEALRLIQSAWTRGVLRATHGFSAQTESETSSEDDGSGRVDILLEIDNAVIGIEVKFWAPFQIGQPEKYLPALKARAQSGEAHGITKNVVLVLLVPAARHLEVQPHVDRLGECACIIEWETLAHALRTVRTVDPATVFLNEELFHFVQRQASETRDLSALLPMLHKDLKDVADTSEHKEFVNWLWPAFRGQSRPPAHTRREQSAGNWIGYSFLQGIEPHSGWFGFVPTRIIDDPADTGTAFIIALDRGFPAFQWNSAHVRPITTHSNWDFDQWQCWQVTLDETLESRQAWRSLLAPLTAAADGLFPRQPSASHD